MNPNSVTEINEALKLDIYGTLEQLFTWRNSFTPSWFDTFKGVKLGELQIEEMPADAWFEKAVEEEIPEAMYIKYLSALQDIQIIKFLSPYKDEKLKYEEKLGENQEIVRKMLQRAAEAGFRPAKLELAKQYRLGGFFEVDFSKALPLFEELYEEKPEADLLYQMGLIHFGGNGIPQNLPKAAEYLRLSGIDRGAMKVAGGPELSAICKEYELCCERRVVIGKKLLSTQALDSLLSEFDEDAFVMREYSKEPEIIMIPLTPDILSIHPYGYDLSTKLRVNGMEVLHSPLTLERLDSLEHITCDNLDKLNLYMVKKKDC